MNFVAIALIFRLIDGKVVSHPGPGVAVEVDARSPPGLAANSSPAISEHDRDECRLEGTASSDQRDIVNFTVAHNLFKTDVLIPGIVYQVIITRLVPEASIEFRLSSTVDGGPKGFFTGAKSSSYICQSHIVKDALDSSYLSVNWTLKSKEFFKSNVTFELDYSIRGEALVYRTNFSRQISQECQLWLDAEEATLNWKEFPRIGDCKIWFPGRSTGHGLVIELNRLNVPCTRGYLHFSGLNASQHQYVRSHKQAHLCGKLEELAESDRHIYFPSSHTSPSVHLHGNPVFIFSYRLVDYCYNMTFITKNGSFELKPSGELECTFKINLPYGNRVALSLLVGDVTSTGTPDTYKNLKEIENGDGKCDGLLTRLLDGEYSWAHCTKPGDGQRQIEIVSRENRVVLKVSVRSSIDSALGLHMSYRAEPVEKIVERCGFGWVALRQFCVAAVEASKLPWAQAEIECARRGGHLASIRSEHAQNAIDNLLLNSPGYRDHNAYWIGASDKTHESDFRWSDGLPFSYSNWFPGWSQHGHYNKQPNDDGLSEQDCVEVRRSYSLPSSSARLASTFMWNDRDCSTPNYFICERLQSDGLGVLSPDCSLIENFIEPLEDIDCNRSVALSRQQPRAAVSSPGFPRPYPDNAECETDITAPPGYRLVLDFEELVLENEPSCSYDYLEIVENASPNDLNGSATTRRLCGDWSSKLKLLRHVSDGSKLRLKFSSDYSHHFGGFKARVSMENVLQCSDDRLQMFNNSCYLFVSYPEVTWATAQQICKGMKAELSSILTLDEEKFVTNNIRKSTDYGRSALYWLGARTAANENIQWVDGNAMEYSGLLTVHNPEDNEIMNNPLCLGVSPTTALPSGLDWRFKKCTAVGGYVCKRPNQISGSGINFNKTLNGSEGLLVTPNYPGSYYNNLDFSVRVLGPERTRLVIQFEKLDIESQLECLYDYVELKSPAGFKDGVKWCGHHDADMHRFDFVSETNEAEVHFHSDYSISGTGFSAHWQAIDVSGCPVQTLTAREGTITSPNYPNFLLAHLDCSVTILAPANKRVWLNFENYQLGNEDYKESLLEIALGKDSPAFRPFQNSLLTEGTFVSNDEQLQVRFRTGDRPQGRGFKATYKTLSVVQEERFINLTNTSSGFLMHLNYPAEPSGNVDFLQHFIAPPGHIISLELHNVKLSETDCGDDKGIVEVYDNYADSNGTSWSFCFDSDKENVLFSSAPTAITSYFNTLHVRQKSGRSGMPLSGSLRTLFDPNYKKKLLKHKEISVESCNLNPCQNGGKCNSKGKKKYCQCTGHFTGLFCTLTQCELEPCTFGVCELSSNGHKCHCKSGYVGAACDQKQRPCEGNPCENRGTCLEKGNGFQCQCHAWWEGTRCERRMLHIPYKPLSERMLEEPFWLGLITVSVVMALIGIVWCAKRHFPEKIEKLLAEDSDHHHSLSTLRNTSLREQLAASSASAVAVAPSPGPGAPRSLFGRLGIRKPSILSLTSPHASGYAPATARTFSLDDLLKTPPRRTPSPRKKRNNSTPTKKNAAEKKQILQQLISPAGSKQLSRKVSLGELMQLTERKTKNSLEQKPDLDLGDEEIGETKFGNVNIPAAALTDPKLEKKVTFARLLNRVSAEMSSGSDMEMGIMQVNRLGCVLARPASTPPSPAVEARSPNSTSSNQGSDTLSSSDLAIPSALSSSISDFMSNRKHARLPNGRQKPASADSILAMFRNFSASSAGANLSSSLRVSPSTTPTASTPQDDMGDDESSTSSIHTPVSFSSGPPESPIMHRQTQGTIEVPVLDVLSAYKNSNSGCNLLHPPTILLEIPSTINKCLSPIREMPTPLPSPMPSPAITPLMHRSTASSITDISDDKISVELPNISISFSDGDEDDMHCIQDIAIDPQAEDGLIQEEAAVMQQGSPSVLIKIKCRPPPLGAAVLPHPLIIETPESNPNTSGHPPLVIPTLTLQTPSPTLQGVPSLSFPGSPPPQRGHSFQFPPKYSSRKMLKEFDKPTSLDLPTAPPMITVTCNMSETESDADCISPAVKNSDHLGTASSGMCYLSPFSMGSRGDRTASESNLSSSGYSSMASPGPSRCGSSNPLCPSEMEDPGPPGLLQSLTRRTSPLLRTTANPTDQINNAADQREPRGRSDSETLSDDPLLESNDEGIGTDHLDEKIEDGELKSARELEVFIIKECDSVKTLCEVPVVTRVTKCCTVEANMDRLMPPSLTVCKSSLQLPSIVVQNDLCGIEKHLSPVSSRSESPLSDRTTGIDRFSPQFYGRHKDLLPFTDSDGLYDFPSSDKVNVASLTHQHRKSMGKRREKKSSRTSKTPSPTKTQIPTLLDVPGKDSFYRINAPRKPSPKRRARTQQLVSSSSSDSINSTRDFRLSSSSPSPDTIRWAAAEWPSVKEPKSPEASGEETGDDIGNVILPKCIEDVPKTRHRVSRLRTISHQIRFLRRLEMSLKRRDRALSPSDSLESGEDDEDSPRATSPLLQPSKVAEIRKSSSIGRLQTSVPNSSTKNRCGKYKRGEPLIPKDERAWKQVVITGNGHSD